MTCRLVSPLDYNYGNGLIISDLPIGINNGAVIDIILSYQNPIPPDTNHVLYFNILGKVMRNGKQATIECTTPFVVNIKEGVYQISGEADYGFLGALAHSALQNAQKVFDHLAMGTSFAGERLNNCSTIELIEKLKDANLTQNN